MAPASRHSSLVSLAPYQKASAKIQKISNQKTPPVAPPTVAFLIPSLSASPRLNAYLQKKVILEKKFLTLA